MLTTVDYAQGEFGDKKAKHMQEEILEHLNKTWVDMTKATKATSSVWDKALNMPSPSPRVESCCTKVAEALEKAEEVVAEVGWILKFKKMKGGSALSVSAAQSLQSKAAELLCELLDYTKSLRALMPKKDE